MTRVYYNDSDDFVCAWLKNLIAAGHLPAGDVDERPIEQVQPSDVAGYDQCHFFAGIGGWAYALQLAGWGDRPVWTGSCPCQPFSAAGQGKAADDPRHLWPHWFRLIRECKPGRIFGEQVANAAGHGWLDVVSAELEAEAYTVGAVVLGAHSVGAPHIRQRLWFVADADRTRQRSSAGRIREPEVWHDARRRGPALELAHAEGSGRPGEQLRGDGEPPERITEIGPSGCVAVAPREQAGITGLARQPWDAVDWLPCTDGKSRPVEPGTFPLASRIPQRVGRLRAYGNSIVAQTAAAFIVAYTEVTGGIP